MSAKVVRFALWLLLAAYASMLLSLEPVVILGILALNGVAGGLALAWVRRVDQRRGRPVGSEVLISRDGADRSRFDSTARDPIAP